MISLNDVLLAMSNIPVDDPIAEIWGRQMQGGYRIIEYTGTLPITINANGDVLLDYRIYGADGGVGVATKSGEPAGYKLPMTVGKNLYNPQNDIQGYYITSSGTITPSYTNNNFISEKIPVLPGNKYTLYYPLTISGIYIACAFYDDSDSFLSATSINSTTQPYEKIYDLVAPANAAYFQTSIKRESGSKPKTLFVERMYDTPIYIGENQLDSVEGVADYVDKASGKIVRMIGEYTFTGDENVSRYGSRVHRILLAPAPLSTKGIISTRCSHFIAINNTTVPNFTNYAEYTCMISTENARFCVNYVGDVKVYFKEQYDNGTPVKVWYILETPTEEDPPVPLPEIPTIDGTTIIDYDGTPKPSQMYIKYKGKG